MTVPEAGDAGLSAAEAAVLLAAAAGADTVEKIARLLNADPAAVKKAVERLVARGYLGERTERRLLLFKRKRIVLTEKGLDALPDARRLLLHAAELLAPQRPQPSSTPWVERVAGGNTAAEEELVESLAALGIGAAMLPLILGLLGAGLALGALDPLGPGWQPGGGGHGGHR